MTKLFRNFLLLLAGLLVVSMLAGCSDVDDPGIPVPTIFSVTPPSGTAIPTNETITVNFNRKPTDVKVSAGTVRVTGKTAIITGPFPLGALTLIITWADGTLVQNYTITGPD